MRTARRPRIVWIELTSRCPFDCIFCSRKLLRGNGRHLDFNTFRRLVDELESPDIIRLNYSGESAHYPQIVEACELAAATGARVELVSAIAALPEHKLSGLVRAGLTRLTISLHTLDPMQFTEIYRFGTLEAMRRRIDAVVELARTAPRALEIDFAFVAMRRNLSQLPAVAAYARKLGLRRLAVHPVIRRDPIEETFAQELEGDRLRPEFVAALRDTITATKLSFPDQAIESSTPELEQPRAISDEPNYFPGPLPPGAVIHTCDQNPWETVHILADGTVVSCEQRDRIPLGNLTEQSFAEIWHSADYKQFRADFMVGNDSHCASCPYKKVRLPTLPPQRFLAPSTGRASLLDGWFEEEDAKIAWSRPHAKLQLRARGLGKLLIRGFLPDAALGKNRLDVYLGGKLIASVSSRKNPLQAFVIERVVEAHGEILLEFCTAKDYCPIERGHGEDARRLGFALTEACFEEQP